MRLLQTCFVLGILAAPALASAQIKQPGDHSMYGVELEPHLLLEWNNYAPCSEDAFGPGFRATIPFLQNGPIPRINNNMGISFGLDWAHAGINDGCAAYFRNGVFVGNDFTADIWTIPVVVQWNFFLLPKISVFGEAGLVIEHRRYDLIVGGNCGPNGFCEGSSTDTYPDFALAGGGRFMVSNSVGFLLRIGYPYISAGVSILL
ncbi:MAG TPA: hypothetical protein VHV51_22375 [Polyangiaceae bacterium]|jgi:hypothetical protein|nr:hypothetical protein [Polyangiaceae bacterium]